MLRPTANEDAIFIPLRLQLALLCCAATELVLCNTVLRYGADRATELHSLGERYLDPFAVALTSVAAHVANATGTQMAIDQLQSDTEWLMQHYTSFAEGVQTGATAGGLLALLAGYSALLAVWLDFRANILRARVGLLPYAAPSTLWPHSPTPSPPLRHAWLLVGGAICSCAMSFLLTATVLGAICLLLSFSLVWSVVGYGVGSRQARAASRDRYPVLRTARPALHLIWATALRQSCATTPVLIRHPCTAPAPVAPLLGCPLPRRRRARQPPLRSPRPRPCGRHAPHHHAPLRLDGG